MTFPIAFFSIAGAFAVLSWPFRRRPLGAAVLVNLAAIFVALGLAEAYLDRQEAAGDGTRLEGSIVNGFTRPDDLLGYAPEPNASVTARKLFGDTVLYDVTYTTNAHGLRITADALPDARACVVFFGDSITFGEGVRDNEDFPYVVSRAVGDRYKTYNFAFSGYGPHQMLANLDSGRVDRIVNCMPKYFYYLAIPDHAARVAGIYSWDRHGPRYELAPDGSVVQRGHFDDPEPQAAKSAVGWVEELLSASTIGRRLLARPAPPEPVDLSLLVGVVTQAARQARDRFPDSVFEVILWDVGDPAQVQAIEQGFRQAGLHVRLMTSLVPDFRQHPEDYVLSEHDRHPNKAFHRLIGEQIAREVLAGEPVRGN
ncbi:hypothetical protein SAMN02745126_04908 [Enhydrobacter aerosaccus]|uniref:SGNH/GDSL hydrolase family protein n=1 Tax=Enhydrobacter aerosaccus TaxID=225324 RepID=A0A1T4SQR1_9HYPH|nr:hypothetical protein [Enhydrobacter aerosaccus]SKA30211.1 hypothetical protein SAMN02745126_04908 [Enhydrobacter aerosaccus]